MIIDGGVDSNKERKAINEENNTLINCSQKRFHRFHVINKNWRVGGYILYQLKMVLSQEEIDGCREAFLAFDKDRSGSIDVWELRQVLEV